METQSSKAGLRDRIRSRRAARCSTPAEVVDSALLCEHACAVALPGRESEVDLPAGEPESTSDPAHRSDSRTGERRAPSVLAYAALPGEPNLDPFLDRVLAAGGAVYLPVVTKVGRPLLFGQVTGSMRSISPRGRWGIREPSPEFDADELLSTEVALDFVLVPALGFSAEGARLGNGGGFYDRTFGPLGQAPLGHVGSGQANQSDPQIASAPDAGLVRPEVFGICFSSELGLPGLVAEDWDLHIPRAITETGIHEFATPK